MALTATEPFFVPLITSTVIIILPHGSMLVWIESTQHFTYARTWSSVTRSWGDRIVGFPTVGMVDFRPSTLIGGFMYWHLTNNHIIAYDVAKFLLHPIKCPEETAIIFRRNVHVVKLDGNAPGLAALNHNGLKIWALASPIGHGSTWVWKISIPWADILPDGVEPAANLYSPQCRIVAVYEDRNVCLIHTPDCVFEVDYIKKSFIEIFIKTPGGTMFPYTSFFILGWFIRMIIISYSWSQPFIFLCHAFDFFILFFPGLLPVDAAE